MLIKWVTCRAADRTAFDQGQRAWAGLRGLAGFLGQGGGWSRHEPGLAHIFGCWADRPGYERFMAGAHDQLAPAQAGTYQQITVGVFERRSDIGGRFPAGLADAALAQLARCQVRTERQAHFIRAQAEVWNPGMAGAPGMRGGVFAQRGESEFLVLSLWRSALDHDRYLAERFPSIAGDLVDLEPAWTVTA